MLSRERATEKVVIQYNFQSHFTGNIGLTLCICIYLITCYRILQNGNYLPQRAFTFASNSIERSRMCAFLMTAENRETSYLSMKTENKHKINVVYLDTVLEL